MKTATEIITKLYEELKFGQIAFTGDVELSLHRFQRCKKYRDAWQYWVDRLGDIFCYQYSRERDKIRAWQQADFTLARQLDRAKANA